MVNSLGLIETRRSVRCKKCLLEFLPEKFFCAGKRLIPRTKWKKPKVAFNVLKKGKDNLSFSATGRMACKNN